MISIRDVLSSVIRIAARAHRGLVARVSLRSAADKLVLRATEPHPSWHRRSAMTEEKTWIFEAGDRVPEWLIRQTNCVLRFDRDAIVVEGRGEFQIYPVSPIDADDTM